MRRYHRDSRLHGKLRNIGHNRFIVFTTGSLNLQIKTIRESRTQLFNNRIVVVKKMALDYPLRSTRKTNQSFAVVRCQPFQTHLTTPQILVFHPTAGKKLTERQVAFMILAIKRQTIRIVPLTLRCVGDPQIAPDDRLDAIGHRMRIKPKSPKKIH